jgi:hypothetical protein
MVHGTGDPPTTFPVHPGALTAPGELSGGAGPFHGRNIPSELYFLYRTLYAFDPRRSAILLVGGDKTGDNRWYEEHLPIADQLYDEHLEQLRKEGLING